jgi:hypothetical protein
MQWRAQSPGSDVPLGRDGRRDLRSRAPPERASRQKAGCLGVLTRRKRPAEAIWGGKQRRRITRGRISRHVGSLRPIRGGNPPGTHPHGQDVHCLFPPIPSQKGAGQGGCAPSPRGCLGGAPRQDSPRVRRRGHGSTPRISRRRALLRAVQRRAFLDDPFLPPGTVPVAAMGENPSFTTLLTERGGHVGFIEGSPRRPRLWGEETGASFLAETLGTA